MVSASEAEYESLFHHFLEAELIRATLNGMGHPQPVTHVQTDNSIENGIANNILRQSLSKSVDMRFYCIPDQTKQDHFHVFWKPVTENLGYYFITHHPLHYHR